MKKTIDCSDLVGTYSLDQAKDLIKTIQSRINKLESEELIDAAHQEDNDLKYMGAMKKAKRHINLVRFQEENIKQRLIDAECFVNDDDETKIIIVTKLNFIADYFPKADKLLIRAQNKWITNGLNYIKKHYLLHNEDTKG
jgi:hypothetical protein